MDIINLLKEKLGEENIKLNEPMSKHTSFKTGGNADIFLKANSIENLKNILEIAKKQSIPMFILGNGSNILVTDKGIRGIVCKIEIAKFEIKQETQDIYVTVGSGNKNAEIAQKLLNLGIEGFEFASRNTRYYWWRNKNECRSLWKRNERHRGNNNCYRLFWQYPYI